MKFIPLGGARRFDTGRCPFCDERVNGAGGVGRAAHIACLRAFDEEAYEGQAADVQPADDDEPEVESDAGV